MKLLGHYIRLPIAMMFLVEFAVASLAFLFSGLLVLMSGYGAGAGDHLLEWSPAFALALVLGITSMGLYQGNQRLRREGVAIRLVVGIGVGMVLASVWGIFLPLDMDVSIWLISFPISLILIGITRGGLWRWVESASFRRSVMVYGAGKRAESLLNLRRRSDRRGFDITAFVRTAGDQHPLADVRVTTTDSLFELARTHGVDEVVVAMDDRRQGFPIDDLQRCKFSGISVIEVVDFLERETGKVKVDLVNPSRFIFSGGSMTLPWLRMVTRVMDFAVALFALILAAPIMLVVALAIGLDDGWPVFYSQRRVGRLGKTFMLYKFRSMVRDAEAGGAQWAQASDRRVTRVGAFIRKVRLDELPQLFNVLCGDMSLVGPRPERPEFVAELAEKIPYYHQRHTVNPGITGWAQLRYPYGCSDHDAQEKLQYDLFYIKHKSLVLDLLILLQTVEVVLWRKGAR